MSGLWIEALGLRGVARAGEEIRALSLQVELSGVARIRVPGGVASAVTVHLRMLSLCVEMRMSLPKRGRGWSGGGQRGRNKAGEEGLWYWKSQGGRGSVDGGRVRFTDKSCVGGMLGADTVTGPRAKATVSVPI